MKKDGLGEEAVDAMLEETKIQEPKLEQDEKVAKLDGVVEATNKTPMTPEQPEKK